MLKKYGLTLAVIFFVCLIAAPVFANKSAAAIDAPEKAAKGSVIKIKVTVTHSGNNFMHHTDWAYVKVNGKEVKRWEFSAGSLPESETFTREIDYTVEGDGTVTIEAEADCNIHGSAGKVEKKIEIQ
jgi:desulfoferrodoxin (superoxide reductase-like protein)